MNLQSINMVNNEVNENWCLLCDTHDQCYKCDAMDWCNLCDGEDNI